MIKTTPLNPVGIITLCIASLPPHLCCGSAAVDGISATTSQGLFFQEKSEIKLQ